MLTIRLSFLGPVHFRRDGQIVELNIAKMQALLAYLAVTGAPQTRDHLRDLLWPESHPDAARKNLRNSLWRMRQKLGDDVLVGEDDVVMLSSTVWTDVSAFESGLAVQLAPSPPASEQLQATLDIWRGSLLAGINLAEAPDFELWLRAERDRLGQLYLRGLNQLLANQRATARWHEVIATAQRALVYDNTQESMHVAVMDAYAKLGQRSDALRQYDLLRTVLDQELGIAPLPATNALRAQILGGELAAGAPPMSAPSMPVPSPISSPNARRSSAPRPHLNRPFVGRQAECDALDGALQIAAGGRLQIVLLAGELGIGKSTLWRQWSATLPEEMTVLTARCLESTQTMPFAPLTGLFGTQICLDRISTPQSSVSAIWLSELTRLLPQLRDLRPDLPATTPLPPAEERRRLFEAFVQTLRALQATPLLLFIDDLHWADQATLDWLVYMADRMRDQPLLLVGAYRASEASPTLTQAVADWGREEIVQRLSLAPLTAQEATALIAALDGNMEMAGYLHTQSGGNPYYLTELSRVHPDGMPGALADLISARLRGLSVEAQRLLQVAAILEPAISFDLLQSVSQQSEDETLDALDALLDMRVLVEHGDTYEFAHPLLARIVRDSLSTARRKRLHRRVAEQLQSIHADALETIVGQLTRHYAEAGDRREAARYAEMAAANAAQIGAMTEAANFYRQAYALEPTSGRQLELGYALMHVPGGVDEAREAMQAALATAESQQDHQGIVQAGLKLAISYLSTEQGEQVLYWAERIARNLQENDHVELRATVQYLMGAGKLNTEHGLAAADGHYREATRLATKYSLDSDIAIQSWFGWGNLSVQCGDFQAAQAKFQQTLALARATRDIYFEALCYNNLAYAALLAADFGGARGTIDTGLAFVEHHELMRPRQYIYSTRGEVALAEGDLDGAESWFKRALKEAEVYHNTNHAINVRAHLGRVAQARGEYETAGELLNAARHAIPAESALHLQIQIDLWLAELNLARDDKAAAQSLLCAAKAQLAGAQRQALQAEADRIAAQLGAG